MLKRLASILDRLTLRRLAHAAGVVACLIWNAAPAEAYFPFANSNASYSSATVCSDVTLHTITTTGPSSFTMAAGCNHVVLAGWSGGGAGGSKQFSSGGDGGAFANSGSLSCAAGTSVFFNVGAPGVGVTSGPGGNGGQTWANCGTNAAPASSSLGIAVDFGHGGCASTTNTCTGTPTPGGLCASSVFAGTCFGGGVGASQNSSNTDGGGGGAGSTGAGGNATTASGGAAGGTDGGAGGLGSTSAPTAGSPNGGGGGSTNNTTLAPNGARGQLTYQQSVFLDLAPANDNAFAYSEAA